MRRIEMAGIPGTRRRRAALTAGAISLVALAAGLIPPARATAGPVTLVATAGAPTSPLPATATSLIATCGTPGAHLISGGMWADNADPADLTPPINGLRAKSSYPSDAAGVPVADGAVNPTVWSATANFGGEAEAGDQVTSLAVCAVTPVPDRIIASASVVGPTVPRTEAQVTVACPPGTVVLGGGAMASPPDAQSFKSVGMYPSDAAGTMLPAGAINPTYWTAVGSTGGSVSPNQTTTAFAVCAVPPDGFAMRVARIDADGPQIGSAHTTTTVGCGPDPLFGGGVLVDNSAGPLQQGVHLRGSYPSTVGGTSAPAGTAPAAWSAITNAGGQDPPKTLVHTFALCATPAVTTPTTTPTTTPAPGAPAA